MVEKLKNKKIEQRSHDNHRVMKNKGLIIFLGGLIGRQRAFGQFRNANRLGFRKAKRLAGGIPRVAGRSDRTAVAKSMLSSKSSCYFEKNFGNTFQGQATAFTQ
ncbi:MAG: hypothetical protein WC882_03115 [Candidatus Gracilibacteria bacterium]